MQYTLSLTPRMLVIAGVCLSLLFLFLFLLGVEIGKKYATETTIPNVNSPATLLQLTPQNALPNLVIPAIAAKP